MSSPSRVSRPLTIASVCLLALLAATGCSAAPAKSGNSSTPAPSSAHGLSAAKWAEDLDELDRQVRDLHPGPFDKTPESRWKQRIADLMVSLPKMSAEDADVAMIELVALLDTHSGIYPEELGFHFYPFIFQEFSDGAWVIAAKDASLIGARLTGVDGHPISKVLATLAPLVNGDNASGISQSRPYIGAVAEILHSKGLVADVAHPGFEFALPDASTKRKDFTAGTYDQWSALYAPPPTAPEASKRAGEVVYTRIQDHAFIINYNDTGTDATEAIAAMKTALKRHTANRVVLDMRNAGGGEYMPTLDLQKALADPLVNRKGRLVVITSMNNTSAGGALASALKTSTRAVFVGQAPPVRPPGFLDPTSFVLPNSRLTVHIPTSQAQIPGAHFTGDEITPDVAIWSTGRDYFAGRDPVLAAALAVH